MIRYTKDHEWIAIKDNIAVVGITDYAQGELGDIVFIECDVVGEDLEKGDVFGTVEAVKTVSDLYLPVSGKVVEFNEEVENTPELVNEDAEGEGWIIKLEVDSPDLSDLMTEEEYKEMIG